MKTKIVIVMSMVGIMLSCQPDKEKQASRQTIDSLRLQLKVNEKLTSAMVDIGALLDSIDANRKALRIKMFEGTFYEAYASRMRDINSYVKTTEQKIEALETAARKSRNTSSFTAAIKKLKGDLEIRNHELKAMEEQVNLYRNKNDNLVHTVNLQNAEIEDKLSQLRVKQGEVSKLEDQVKQLMTQSKLDEGEAYFARAVAIEETAKRTHFAPRKKKNTRKEALELYRLALSYGKNEAQTKIAELEKKL